MNSNFLLLQKTKKTMEYIQKIAVNYPKKEYILKGNIEKSCYQLIECIFSYQIKKIDKFLFYLCTMFNFHKKFHYLSYSEIISRFTPPSSEHLYLIKNYRMFA